MSPSPQIRPWGLGLLFSGQRCLRKTRPTGFFRLHTWLRFSNSIRQVSDPNCIAAYELSNAQTVVFFAAPSAICRQRNNEPSGCRQNHENTRRHGYGRVANTRDLAKGEHDDVTKRSISNFVSDNFSRAGVRGGWNIHIQYGRWHINAAEPDVALCGYERKFPGRSRNQDKQAEFDYRRVSVERSPSQQLRSSSD